MFLGKLYSRGWLLDTVLKCIHGVAYFKHCSGIMIRPLCELKIEISYHSV